MRAQPLRAVLVLVLAACGSATTPSTSTTNPPPVTSAGDTITVDPSAAGPAISSLVLGANMATWFDITQSGVATALQTAGFASTRWPGGSESDNYYWKRNLIACASGGYAAPGSTFDHFMTQVAQPAHLDVAITLNYGSDSTCTLPGDPAVAAAWVAYSLAQHYGITHWTVGNESYGHWETDLHPSQWDPTTYASAVKNGYYPQIKAADASAQVGVVVSGGGFNGWDQTVLANASYDYVELHYYDQNPGSESDTALVLNGARRLMAAVSTVQTELSQAGKSVPIYVGELGSVNTNPGKQTMSITQALYAAQSIGTLMQLGVTRATWWLAFGGCNTSSSGNFSSSLYGWQNFAGYMIISDGIPTPYECTGASNVPLGTLLPTARAYQLLSQFAVTGEHMVGVSLGDSLSTIRAWSATSGSGYALLLVNVDDATTKIAPLVIKGHATPASLTVTTYGKLEYDDSRNNVWTGPTQTTVTTGAVTLPPWSITVVRAP